MQQAESNEESEVQLTMSYQTADNGGEYLSSIGAC